MADSNKDLVARLTDLSEGAIQRLSEAPGAERAVQALKSLADKVDELQRRTRGVEELEKRMTALEKRVDAMAKPKTARKPASRARAKPASTAKKGLISRPRRRRLRQPSRGAGRRRRRSACGSPRARAARRRPRARPQAGSVTAATRPRARTRRSRNAARDRSATTSRTRRGARRPGGAARRVSVCRNTSSTATAPNHAAVQHTAASTRPRVQSRHAAARTSSERDDDLSRQRHDLGHADAERVEAARAGAGRPTRATSALRTARPRAASHARRPTGRGRVVAPEATRTASVTNAAAAAAARLRSGHPQPQRRRDDLEPRRSRADRLAVHLQRQRLVRARRDRRGPQQLDLRDARDIGRCTASARS